MNELAKHVMEDDPHFYESKKAILLVAGSFGCGSSREQAPRALSAAGIRGILAPSFARIFFRNAINCGLAALECDTSLIEDGDELEIDLLTGKIVDHSQGIEIKAQPLPPVMVAILREGGLSGIFQKIRVFSGVRK